MGNDYLTGIGDDESAGASAPLPESLFPVNISLTECAPSANAGTPGVHVNLLVTDGAYAGMELDKFSARWYIWAPKSDGKYYARQREQRMGYMKNLTKVMTGKDLDYTAQDKHGCTADNIDDFWDWYRDLDPEAKTAFIYDFMRLASWTGKNVMAKISCKEEKMEDGDGNPLLDDAGQPRFRDRNEIVNIFAHNHTRYGLASWKGVHESQQEKMFKMQFEG